MKQTVFVFFFLLCVLNSQAQSPNAIQYQAILRDAGGNTLPLTSCVVHVSIHTGVNGVEEYGEYHNVISDANGWLHFNVGSGMNTIGNWAAIAWSEGNKFISIGLNSGNGEVPYGTNALLSVPYALWSNDIAVRVSATGDTLSVGANDYVIVPGISAANGIQTPPTGAELLPGNAYCATSPISVTGCGGLTSLTYQGDVYDLVEIAGQCWMADNLKNTSLRDGTPITQLPLSAEWSVATGPAYCYYQNLTTNQTTYGNLYNFATVSTGLLCPAGWHVPSDCEWMYLESNLGMDVTTQLLTGFRGTTEGDALKSVTGWNTPSTPANNSTGFTALPGGYRFTTGSYNGIGMYGYWWTSSPDGTTGNAWDRKLNFGNSNISRGTYSVIQGKYIRCVKD